MIRLTVLDALNRRHRDRRCELRVASRAPRKDATAFAAAAAVARCVFSCRLHRLKTPPLFCCCFRLDGRRLAHKTMQSARVKLSASMRTRAKLTTAVCLRNLKCKCQLETDACRTNKDQVSKTFVSKAENFGGKYVRQENTSISSAGAQKSQSSCKKITHQPTRAREQTTTRKFARQRPSVIRQRAWRRCSRFSFWRCRSPQKVVLLVARASSHGEFPRRRRLDLLMIDGDKAKTKKTLRTPFFLKFVFCTSSTRLLFVIIICIFHEIRGKQHNQALNRFSQRHWDENKSVRALARFQIDERRLRAHKKVGRFDWLFATMTTTMIAMTHTAADVKL